MEVKSIDEIVKEKLSGDQLKEFNRIYYGRITHGELRLKESTAKASKELNLDIAAYSFNGASENPAKFVKIGLIQHSIVLPTTEPIHKQKEAMFNKVEKIISIASSEGVQILCLQETWYMPFFLCTKEKEQWKEFAESPTDGSSFHFLSALAKKHNMVMISPILEIDNEGTWWNTSVIIDELGQYLGKHRKNHLPSVGSFSETAFYSPGDTGHPVFETKFAKIAINICYGRHHALNWLMFAINGADIIFNPSATIAEFGESFWGIEARNAAIANGYFTCSINRVGIENFKIENSSKSVLRSYGSSYVTAPNGIRTPGLSRSKDGLLIVEVDLNFNKEVRLETGYHMTARLDTYAKKLKERLQKKS